MKSKIKSYLSKDILNRIYLEKIDKNKLKLTIYPTFNGLPSYKIWEKINYICKYLGYNLNNDIITK